MRNRSSQQNENGKKVVFTIIATFITSTIVISIFGMKGDEWYEFLVEWQALIAGFFAICAAFITVNQMEKSDRKLEKRHGELLMLQMRPDYLLIEQFCNPQITEFMPIIEQLEYFAQKLDIDQDNAFTAEHIDSFATHPLILSAKTLHFSLHSEQMENGRRLLSGNMNVDFHELRVKVDRLYELTSMLDRQKSIKVDTLRSEAIERFIEEQLPEVLILVTRLRDSLRRFVGQMVDLWNLYQPQIDYGSR